MRLHLPPQTPTKEKIESARAAHQLHIKKKQEEELARRQREQKEKEEKQTEYLKSSVLTSDGYTLWLKRDTWYLDQAIALLFGKDPKKVGLYSFNSEMMEIKEIAMSSIRAGTLRFQGYGSLYEIRTADFLVWALEKGFDMPEELKTAAEKCKQYLLSSQQIMNVNQESEKVQTSTSKFKKLRPEQSHRERCRGIAALLWGANRDITIEDMICKDEITIYGCENKLYHEETMRDWINDLCPNRSPGRRPKNK